MRKIKNTKIKYEYIYGDNPTLEQIKESREVLNRVYDRIFNIALENLRSKHKLKGRLIR